MTPGKNPFARLVVPLAAIAIGSACIVGTGSAPQIIEITATRGNGEPEGPASSPTMKSTTAFTPTWTATATLEQFTYTIENKNHLPVCDVLIGGRTRPSGARTGWGRIPSTP